MTSGKDGEQPIFSCRAHVFHIDPKTKRSWMPASNNAVSVSFFYDSTRYLYRIISVEDKKAVINSTVTPNMTFTKTSQKFGQWSDVRANTVYGLGFSSEAELQKFIDKFKEVKEATRSAISKVTSNNGSAVTPVTSANASPITARAANLMDQVDNLLEPPGSAQMPTNTVKSDEDNNTIPHPRSHSVSGAANESPSHQKATTGSAVGNVDNKNLFARETTGNLNDVQLKYENERLKSALAQSSANAKKWEIELSTLKSNNSRLTSALQESTANVEEWKRQLANYKEENLLLKTKHQADLENSKGGGDIADELRQEIHLLRIRLEQLETELDSKNCETKHFQNLQRDFHELQATVKLAESELDIRQGAHDSQRQVLLTLNQQFASRIQELVTIHDEIHTALQT